MESTPLVEEVVQGDYAVTFHLVETVAGAGDWQAQHVAVRRVDDGPLTMTSLRDLPLRRCLNRAIEKARARTLISVASPSDLPPAFREGRRGRAQRTERDFAQLADVYLMTDPKRRPDLAEQWAKQYGLGKATFRNHLSKARRYIDTDKDMLNEEGLDALLGSGGMEADERVTRAERWLAGEWTAAERREHQQEKARDPRALADLLRRKREWAQREVEGFYS